MFSRNKIKMLGVGFDDHNAHLLINCVIHPLAINQSTAYVEAGLYCFMIDNPFIHDAIKLYTIFGLQ